ncbi:hypothetical protein BC940DRAFT_333143 [Gongronella butleri]|nr:hypothetical protein BC940DRAFT_333143 [Gongronella butleri]
MPVPFRLGAKLSIHLAEDTVLLRGLHADERGTAVLRGEVTLDNSKSMAVSSVHLQLIGKAATLWPGGLNTGRITRYSYEKKVYEQQITLLDTSSSKSNSADDGKTTEGVQFAAGVHKWPFECILPNNLVETIEDDTGKVFYTLTATLHKAKKSGAGLGKKLTSRRNILVLRTPSDLDLANNSLPSTSIVTERHNEAVDAVLVVEKTAASSGTAFPIDITLMPHMKNVYLESLSALLIERRVYRLPEFDTQRGDSFSFRMPLQTIIDQNNRDAPVDPRIRRAAFTKNAHVPLAGDPFQFRFQFALPNCLDLSHSTTFPEIDIQHFLKLSLTFDTPAGMATMHLESNVTVLDCRLKQDYTSLPTYEASLATPAQDAAAAAEEEDPSYFYVCPCYLAYKKKGEISKKEWLSMRGNKRSSQSLFDDAQLHAASTSASSSAFTTPDLPPPPSYDDLSFKT